MAKRKPKPLNPYIAGSALDGAAGFFGRADILRLVETELRSPHQNAVVLFGQRRIGKTSILLQLRRRLPESSFLPVYLDLMDRARRPMGALLAELADNVALELGLEPPEAERFDDKGRYFRQGFLPAVYEALGEDEAARRLVFLFDEFDVLDVAAAEELPEAAAARAFFPYLRQLMGQEKRLGFVIVIGRKTEELSTDFRAAFRAAQYQKVSVLAEDDARALIGLAEEEGSLRYTPAAVERILALTAAHPFFTQLTCFLLFNRTWTGDVEDVPLVDAPDVDAIVPRVLEAGNTAFEWIWDGLPPAERIIFSAIAEGTDEGRVLNEDQIIKVLQEHGIRILIRDLELAPRTLVDWEMLRRVNGGYRFFIELMRRWVAENKPLARVRDELDRVSPLADQLYQVGHTFYRQKSLEGAVAQLRQAVAINPNHLKARLLLGTCLREQGNLAAAAEELEWAYEYDAQAARYELVRTLLQQGERLEREGAEDKALAIYEHVLEVSPRETVARERRLAIYVRRGDAALESGDYDAALAAYEQAGAREKLREATARKRRVELEAYARRGEEAEATERVVSWPLNPFEVQWFVGRDDELGLLYRAIRFGRSVAVVGPPYMGKSDLLYQIRKQASEWLGSEMASHYEFVLIDGHMYGGDEGFSPARFWETVFRQVKDNRGLDLLEEQDISKRFGLDSEQQNSRRFRLLSEERVRLVLIIDEFHIFFSHPGFSADFFAELRALSSHESLSVITAGYLSTVEMQGRLEDKFGEKSRALFVGSPLFNYLQELQLGPFTDDEVEQFYKKGLSETDIPFVQQDLEYIRAVAGDIPRLVQWVSTLVFDAYRSGSLDAAHVDEVSRYDKINVKIEGAKEIFDGLYTRLKPGEQQALIFLAVLHCADALWPKIPHGVKHWLLTPLKRASEHFGSDVSRLIEQGLVNSKNNSYSIRSRALLKWIQRFMLPDMDSLALLLIAVNRELSDRDFREVVKYVSLASGITEEELGNAMCRFGVKEEHLEQRQGAAKWEYVVGLGFIALSVLFLLRLLGMV